MRVVPLQERVRLHMSTSEYKFVLTCAPNKKCYFASRIEAECSLRIGLVAEVKRGDFYIPDDPDVEIAFVRIRGAKETTEGENALGGKARISWVPRDLYDDLMEWADQQGISKDEELIDVDEKRLGDYVREMRQNAATRSKNKDWHHLTSHDFRAYYATNMVRQKGVKLSMVMEMGGWDSKKAIEPYLRVSQPREFQDELVRAGAVSGDDLPEPPRRDELKGLYKELRRLRELLELDKVENIDDLSAERLMELREAAQSIHEQEEAEETSAATLDDFTEREYVATEPLSATLAERLQLEHTKAKASDKLKQYPLSPQRAMAVGAGLLAWAAIFGTIWGTNGLLAIDPLTHEITASPAVIIGLVLGTGLVVKDVPDL